jgi:endonuclease-3
MQDQDIHQIIPILRTQVKAWRLPVVDGMSQEKRTPYQILITTILSLRTKDTLTEKIAPKLFILADNPCDMARHTPTEIAPVIYPVGFYRRS